MKPRTAIKKIAALLAAALLLLQTACAGAGSLPESGSGAASLPQSQPAAAAAEAPPAAEQSTGPEEGLYTPDFDIQAEAVYLVNEDSGVVVYAKNADTPMVSASLVKMMTSLLAVENVQDLDGETVTAETWVFNELYGKNASNADIWKGETLTVRELLYAMLLPSANEAALMLANYVSGGYMENFLYLMNYKAAELGCTGTYFADPNGLSEENVTTAHDMYLIVKAFMENPTLAEIAATSSYEMAAHNHSAPYNISTTNRLLVASDAYSKKFSSIAGAVLGGKTGSLGEWQNFTSKAVQDGVTYYCVVLHSPNGADALAAENQSTLYRPALYETGNLYTWAFSNFAVGSALNTEKPITEVMVKYSTAQDSVKLLPVSDLKTLLPKTGDAELELVFNVPDFVAAPVQQGQQVGSVTVNLQGKTLGTVQLVAQQSVTRNTFKYVLQKIGEVLNTAVFKLGLLLVALLAVGYAALVWRATQKHQRTKRQGGPPPPSPGAEAPHVYKKPPAGNEPGKRKK